MPVLSEHEKYLGVNVHTHFFKAYSWVVYYLSHYVLRAVFWLYFRIEIVNPPKVLKNQPAIIAGNHVSMLDPPLAGVASGHRVWFLARQTLMKKTWVKWLLLALDCIPLDREGADIRSIRRVINNLKQGRSVVMFPEGTRSKDGRLQPMKAGLGFIVHKAQVPVIATYIHGAHQAMPKGTRMIFPKKIIVEFSNPIYFNELYTQKGSDEIYRSIACQVGAVLYNLEKKYISSEIDS